MRDILNDLDAGKGVDPMKAAQASMRPALPKRFYKAVDVAQADGQYVVRLDGRTAKTSARKVLALPSRGLADIIAAEFAAQGTEIDPMTMPVLRIANPAIDSVSAIMPSVRADVCAYAASDLLCYRASEPERLVARQGAAWDPVIARVEAGIGARFVLAEGVMHQAQPAAALARFAERLESATPDAFTLAATHVMTTLTGSALLALAVTEGWLDAETAWTAAHVDEDWTIEHWGADAEATARRAARGAEFMAAATVAALMRQR